MHTYHHFTLAEREEISRGLVQGMSIRAIAALLLRSPSSVSREINRHWTNIGYRACTAAFRARKRAKVARHPRFSSRSLVLWTLVLSKLREEWSPEQISVWLRRTYAQKTMHISHEAIYQALYVLPKGTLRKELLLRLRRHHKKRHPRGGFNRSRIGQIPNLVSIHDRPADIEKRLIPGHWEGDLLMGKNRHTAIGTLVERTTRYVLLCPLSTAPTAMDAWKAFARRL